MNVRGLSVVVLFVLFSCDPILVPAHEPDNGIYPTHKLDWEGCCHSRDCVAADVEVRFEGDMAHVRSSVGDFVLTRANVFQITQPGAEEHVCLISPGKARCVFYSIPMM